MTYDKDVTPYIHVLVYHAYDFAMKFGELKAFETEALEQLNYVNKLVFFGASNHGKEDFTVTEQVNAMHTKVLDQNFFFSTCSMITMSCESQLVIR